jgi:hypothetical protein
LGMECSRKVIKLINEEGVDEGQFVGVGVG